MEKQNMEMVIIDEARGVGGENNANHNINTLIVEATWNWVSKLKQFYSSVGQGVEK